MSITYIDAIHQAQAELLRDDESVFLYGQDIGKFGGAFKATKGFQDEFNLLWATSAEYGQDLSEDPTGLPNSQSGFTGADALFNSDNYKKDGQSLELNNNVLIKSNDQKYVLTNSIIAAIDSAQESLKIATTRVTLNEVIEAIDRAVQRGVDVEIVLNMDQYKTDTWAPIRKLANTGADIRIKFYNLAYDRSTSSGLPTYIAFQMHSKYVIVDKTNVLTGSFNWSRSGEYNHMENVVAIDMSFFPELQTRFLQNFENVQSWNPEYSEEVKESIQSKLESQSTVGCKFAKPVTFDLKELDNLLNLGDSYGVNLKDDCDMDDTI